MLWKRYQEKWDPICTHTALMERSSDTKMPEAELNAANIACMKRAKEGTAINSKRAEEREHANDLEVYLARKRHDPMGLILLLLLLRLLLLSLRYFIRPIRAPCSKQRGRANRKSRSHFDACSCFLLPVQSQAWPMIRLYLERSSCLPDRRGSGT